MTHRNKRKINKKIEEIETYTSGIDLDESYFIEPRIRKKQNLELDSSSDSPDSPNDSSNDSPKISLKNEGPTTSQNNIFISNSITLNELTKLVLTRTPFGNDRICHNTHLFSEIINIINSMVFENLDNFYQTLLNNHSYQNKEIKSKSKTNLDLSLSDLENCFPQSSLIALGFLVEELSLHYTQDIQSKTNDTSRLNILFSKMKEKTPQDQNNDS